MFLDQAIVDNTVSPNQIAQFFGAAITHDGANNSGAGTIVFKYFSPSGDPRLYPEGIPYTFPRDQHCVRFGFTALQPNFGRVL